MTLKAKGLLSLMFSLPDDWDYSINGLCSICVENESAIKAALSELKQFGYLIVTKKMPNETASGRIEYEYDIFEKPQKQEGKKQEVENLPLEIQPLEIHSQENTNKLNTNKQSKEYIYNIIYIVDFLNSTLNTRYCYQTQTTQKLIKARLNEGFTVDDFKTVIKKKADEWKGTEMAVFLRPETLFGTKFESYLNAPKKTKGSSSKTEHFENERDYLTNECNNLLKDIDDINF